MRWYIIDWTANNDTSWASLKISNVMQPTTYLILQWVFKSSIKCSFTFELIPDCIFL